MASTNAKSTMSSTTPKPRNSPHDNGRGKAELMSAFSSDSSDDSSESSDSSDDDEGWNNQSVSVRGGGRSANDPSYFGPSPPGYNNYRDSQIGERVIERPSQDYDRQSVSPKKGPGYAALTQSRIQKTTPSRSTTFPADGNFKDRFNAIHPSTRSRDSTGERQPLGTLKQPRQGQPLMRNTSDFDTALLEGQVNVKGKSVMRTDVVDTLPSPNTAVKHRRPRPDSERSSPFQPVAGGEARDFQQQSVTKSPLKQMLPHAQLRLENWVENNAHIPKPLVDRRGRGRQETEMGWGSHRKTGQVEPSTKPPPMPNVGPTLPQTQPLVSNVGYAAGPSTGRRNREGYDDVFALEWESDWESDDDDKEAELQNHPSLRTPVQEKVGTSLLSGEGAQRTSIETSADRRDRESHQAAAGYSLDVICEGESSIESASYTNPFVDPQYNTTLTQSECLASMADENASMARQSVGARSQEGRQAGVGLGSDVFRDQDADCESDVLRDEVVEGPSGLFMKKAIKLTARPSLVSSQIEAQRKGFSDGPYNRYERYEGFLTPDEINKMQVQDMIDGETSSEEEARLATPVRPKLTYSSPSTRLELIPAVGGSTGMSSIGRPSAESRRQIPNPVAFRPWKLRGSGYGRDSSPVDILAGWKRRPGGIGLEDQRFDCALSRESRGAGASRGLSVVSQQANAGSVRQMEAMSDSDDQSSGLAANVSGVGRINQAGSSRYSTQTKKRSSNNFKSAFTDNKSKTMLRGSNTLSVAEVKKVSKPSISGSGSTVGPSLQKRQTPQASFHAQVLPPKQDKTQLRIKRSSINQPTASSLAKQREQSRKSPCPPKASRVKQSAVMPQLSTNPVKYNPRSSVGTTTGQLRAPASLPTVATSKVSAVDMDTVAFYDTLWPGLGYRPKDNKEVDLFFDRLPAARNDSYLRNTGLTGRQAFIEEFGREWEPRYEEFVEAWEAVEEHYGNADQAQPLPVIPAGTLKKSHAQQIMPSKISLPLKENLSGRSTSGNAAFDQSKKQTPRSLSPCEIFDTENPRFADDDFRCEHDAKSMVYWAARFSSIETQRMNDLETMQKNIRLASKLSNKADPENQAKWDFKWNHDAVSRAIDVFQELWDLCKTVEARRSLKDYRTYFAREKGWWVLLPAGVTLKEQPPTGMAKMAEKMRGTREERLQQKEEKEVERFGNSVKKQPSRLPVPKGGSPRAYTPQASGGRTWWGGKKPASKGQETSSPLALAAAREALKENRKPGQPQY